MKNTMAKSEIADMVVESTKYGTLVEIAVKDNVYIGETTSGRLWIFEKERGLPGCVTYGSNTLLGRYEGFGTGPDEIFIRLRVIGKNESLCINESQIESITVYKGREYKL